MEDFLMENVTENYSYDEHAKSWQDRILELPKYMLGPISQALRDFGPNDTNFNTFHFRYNLRSHIAVWILIYSLIFAFGFYMNYQYIKWFKSNRKHLCYAHIFIFDLFLGNSVNDLAIKDLIVLPVSFLTMTGVHWVLGRNFCKFFPIVQDSCFYSSSLIILASFYFRFKHVSNCTFNSANKLIEYQPEVKNFSCIPVLIVAFAIALIGVIPHTVYIDYADLGYYVGPHYNGTGVCAVNIENRFMDYVKYLFLLFYVIPVVISFSYFSKTIDIIEKWVNSSEEYATTKRIHIHRGSAVEASLHAVADTENEDESFNESRRSTRNSLTNDGTCDVIMSHHSNVSDEVTDGVSVGKASGDKRGIKKSNNNYRNVRCSFASEGFNSSSPTLDDDVNTVNDGLRVRIHVNKTSDLSPSDSTLMDEPVAELPSRHGINRRSLRSSSAACPKLTFNMASEEEKRSLNYGPLGDRPLPPVNTSGDNRKMSLSPRSETGEIRFSVNEEHSNEQKRTSCPMPSNSTNHNNVSSDEKAKLRSNLDLEQSLQKVMSRILFFQSILLLPFNILRFAKHLIPEKPELNNVYDLLFLVLVGLQFSTMLLIPSLIINIFASDFDHRRSQLDKLKDSPLIQIEKNRPTKSRVASFDRPRGSLTAVETTNEGSNPAIKLRPQSQSTYLANSTGTSTSLQPRRPSAVTMAHGPRRNSSVHRKPSYNIPSTSVHHQNIMPSQGSISPSSSTGYSSMNVKNSNSNVNFADVTPNPHNVNTQTNASNLMNKVASVSSSSITGPNSCIAPGDPGQQLMTSSIVSTGATFLQPETMGLRRKSYQQLNLPSQQMASALYNHGASPLYNPALPPPALQRSQPHHHRTQSVRVTSYVMRDQDHLPYQRQLLHGQHAGRLSLAGAGFESTLISTAGQRGYPQSEV